MTTLHDEVVHEKLRQKLNADKVKLWLPPYSQDNGQKGKIPNELINRYSRELNLPCETVESAIEHLRQHALEKLSAKLRFTETGLATLKLKLAGKLQDFLKERFPDLTVTVVLSLKSTGSELRKALMDNTGLKGAKLKLIAAGRLIEDGLQLEEQGIKNLSTIMTLVLTECETEAKREDDQMARVSKLREAAEYLSHHRSDDEEKGYYLQIADHRGKIIDLPEAERQALTLAMTLHEKGRAAMKEKDYAEAVLLLLEADKEFTKCRADILEAVDNYALVCLDIVWCYLCLQNINQLPDAESRLQTCQECFRRSYGEHLERLVQLKGSVGEEQALFVRLHLLQGILAYHQKRTDQAIHFLNMAKQEISRLQVDEEKMTEVMMMGFSQQEARLGLRACNGDVQQAVNYIMRRKQEKEEIRSKEKEDKRRKKLVKKLGKTANGDEVDITLYENLLEMGFQKGAAAAALRQTNNDIMTALQVLNENPDLLELPDPDEALFPITDDMISQLTAMGFDKTQSCAALHHFLGNTERCIEELIKMGGVVPQNWLEELPTNSTERSSSSKSAEEEAHEKELVAMVVPDLHQEEEDHLDLDLNEEAKLLQEYISLVTPL